MFTPDGYYDVVLFVCSLCGTNHAGIDKDAKTNVHLIPPTITTSKNGKAEYYFHCVICPQNIGKK
jgi:hypothetical protein